MVSTRNMLKLGNSKTLAHKKKGNNVRSRTRAKAEVKDIIERIANNVEDDNNVESNIRMLRSMKENKKKDHNAHNKMNNIKKPIKCTDFGIDRKSLCKGCFFVLDVT